MNGYPEKDWKMFRQKLSQWQESHMEKLCREYIEILGKDTQPSNRFWKLDKRIQEDKHHLNSGRLHRSQILKSTLSNLSEKV